MQGRGLFETMRILQGRLAFFPDHAGRLRRSAAALALSLPSSDEVLLERCARVIAANDLGEGVLKIVVFQDIEGTGELILTRQNPYRPEHYIRGFKLAVVRDGRRPGYLPGLKTLNYLGNSDARRAAQAAGCDDALFVDASGAVLEGATSNVFAVKEGKIFTPALACGILPGVARATVLRLPAGGQAEQGVLTFPQLLEADEVFVTNAVLGVMPVARIEQRNYDQTRNPVTRTVQEAYKIAELAS